MNIRSLVIACFLTISAIPARAQWVQTNSPQNNILTYGGDVSCLAAIGNDLFVGEDGVLLSTDSGTTWATKNNGLNGMGVGQFIVSDDTIFTVTIGGIFVSTDMGMDWVPLLSEVPVFFANISAFTISNGNIIAGTRLDSYLSTDTGKSWIAVDTLFDVSCFAEMGGNLYAGTSDGGMFPTGVYASTNNGVNWTLTDTGERSGKRFVLDLTASGQNLIESTLSGMFLSSDDGANWIAIDSGFPAPTYASRVDAFAVNGQNIYAGTEGDGVYLSTNNGTTWGPLPDIGLTSPYISSLLIDKGNLYAGSDGDGVFLSTDNGSHWIVHNPLTSINSDINGLDTATGKLFACTQVGVFSTTDSGASWEIDSAGMGAISVSAVVQIAGNLLAGTGAGIYISTNNGVIWTPNGLSGENISEFAQYAGILYAVDQGVFVSTNNGVTWKRPANSGVPTTNAFTAIGTNLIAGSNVNPLYYSPDTGNDWYSVQDVPTSCNVNALTVIGNTIYAGTNTDGVWLSTNSGMDWAEANDSGLTDANVTVLFVNGSTLFAGTNSGRIFFSSDSAANWYPVDSGLQAGLQITSLAVKDSMLYAGTSDSGIWQHSLSKIIPIGIVAPPASMADAVTIYPNPSTNSITITSSIGPISILDPLGRSYDVRQAGNTLDISSLPSGVYFVSDGRTRAKFVKK